MGCGVAKVIQDIAASSDTSAELFSFFRAFVHRVVWVSYLFVWWDVMFVNSFEYIDAINITVALK